MNNERYIPFGMGTFDRSIDERNIGQGPETA